MVGALLKRVLVKGEHVNSSSPRMRCAVSGEYAPAVEEDIGKVASANARRLRLDKCAQVLHCLLLGVQQVRRSGCARLAAEFSADTLPHRTTEQCPVEAPRRPGDVASTSALVVRGRGHGGGWILPAVILCGGTRLRTLLPDDGVGLAVLCLAQKVAGAELLERPKVVARHPIGARVDAPADDGGANG